MKCLDLTCETPEENLACDEALLRMSEAGFEGEILRFWEPQQYFVVLGYSGRIHAAVHLQYCQQNNIPVLRRCSGGGTVVQGPGCANFTLILRIPASGPLRTIPGTNKQIMTFHKDALEPVIGTTIEVQGSSDLALGSSKFSGNAQRRTARHILFHGTFLLNFDIPFVEKLLPVPSKQPSYRQNRSHKDFLTNVHIQRDVLKQSLRNAWCATEDLDVIPAEATRELARTRYSTKEWTFRF